MTRGWGLSRRSLLRSWLVSLIGTGAARSTETGFDPIRFTLRGFVPAAAFQRRYRMDATILLLGAPLFTRVGAGGGYASVETSWEVGRDDDAMAVAVQFAAGSTPASAHGLNRFGILREAEVARGDATELSFAGLMTRSREESFEQGRKAMATSAVGAECVVARGKTSGTTMQTWIDTLAVDPDCNWMNLSATLSQALQQQPRTAARETAASSVSTFLHAMRGAALCRETVVRRQFLHAGKLYRLETRRDPKHSPELVGAIHDLSGARCAEFRTAYLAGDESGIPIRIEYRPRSFLRLTLIAESESTEPTIPSVFPKESA